MLKRTVDYIRANREERLQLIQQVEDKGGKVEDYLRV